MALTDNLVSYWKLDEASGNALDAHGSNDLTETSGTIGSVSGKIGNARDFEAGDTEYFTHADNADLSTGDIDFTFACWVNPETLTGFPIVAHKGSMAGTDMEWQIYLEADGTFTFGVSSGATFYSINASNFGAASNGAWHYVVVWHDSVNNQIGIQVNNTTPNTQSHSAGVNDGGQPFFLGALPAQNLYWDGLIDEAGFWKRVLTTQEKTDLYNAGNGFAYPFSTTSIPVFMHHYRQQGIA